MAKEKQGASGSVFISYSRKDKASVQKLNDALDNVGVQAWVDWEGIELASDWMETITNAIQGTDAFIFVISPDSLKSKVCADEIERGLELNKKLIPILYRDPVRGMKIHERLSSTNWVVPFAQICQHRKENTGKSGRTYEINFGGTQYGNRDTKNRTNSGNCMDTPRQPGPSRQPPYESFLHHP